MPGSIRWFLTIGALAVCLGAPGTVFAQDAPSVSVQDDVFDPAQVQVGAGVSLRWSLDGAEQHTITADDGSFDSGILNPSDTFMLTFDTPGTRGYYCQIHGAPGGIGMAGTIVVN
jgi:plastocyanin